MESEIMRHIIDYLLTQGKTWDMLTKYEQALLLKVQGEIDRRLPIIADAEKVLAENAINQSSIAAAIGTTRKTVGSNNKIVAGLIEKYSTSSRLDRTSKTKNDEIKRLTSDIKRYEARLTERLNHEIIEENLKAEIFLLEESLELKRIQFDNLEREHRVLKEEVNHYRKEEIRRANEARELELINSFAAIKGSS